MRQPCEYALLPVHLADSLCVCTACAPALHTGTGSVPIGHLKVRIQWTTSSAYNQ